MTESELDFDPEELAMLRQLFRSEAQDALEAVTARVLAVGSSAPSRQALTEMMRATHTMKGAAGTVGLPAMVDLAHRLENVFASFHADPGMWTREIGELLVQVMDAMRGYLDIMQGPAGEAAADELRTTIDQILQPHSRVTRQMVPIVMPEAAPAIPEAVPVGPETASDGVPEAVAEADAEPDAAAADVPARPEPRSYLRVEPERVDAVVSSAGELLVQVMDAMRGYLDIM
ncbi:MAG TPA: Hpt domain-containing protein, partial [Kofleriaceae bacterium]